MTRRLTLALCLASASLLAACKGSPPAAATVSGRPAAQPQAASPVAKPLEPPPPPPVATFSYDPTGLRDPFQPFIKVEEKEKKAAFVAKSTFVARTPLQRFAVDELKLVGILWTPGGTARALVEDPQNKGYMVTIGTYLGDRGGKIVRIQPDRLVIEEKFTDVLGEEKVTVSNMVLHKAEGEVRR